MHYIDDILVGGSSVHEHNQNLAKVLQYLEEHGLHVKAIKVQLCKKSVNFLGVTVVQGGFHMKEYATNLAHQLRVVKSKKELQKLLGCFNQLISYVP